MKTLHPEELDRLLEELAQEVRIHGGQPRTRGTSCHRTLAVTERILRGMGKSPGEIWLILEECRDLGGFCDCEVLLNVGCREEDDPDGDGLE